MRTTVAICTHNPDVSLLRRALDAIVPQLSPNDAELLIIDNNSSPPLATVSSLTDYPARIIPEPTPGLTAAREAAYAAASGAVIVFVDDDNILGPSYVHDVLQEFDGESRLAIVGGRVVPEYEAPPPRWFDDEMEQWLAVKRYPETFRAEISKPEWSTHFPVGAGMAVRREFALEYQRDCEMSSRIQGRRGAALSSGEDLDMSLFALSTGRHVAVTGRLCLTHVIGRGRLDVDYLRRLAVSNVRSALELEEKWSPRVGAPIFPMFQIPLPKLVARYVIASVAGLRSPRFRIKRAAFAALARARLGRPI